MTPIFKYLCKQCGNWFYKEEKQDRKSPRWCPKCGRRTARRQYEVPSNSHVR